MNQIGSVTESIEAVKMSKRAGWGVMASHRRYPIFRYFHLSLDTHNLLLILFLSVYFYSGETEDTFIADLSVGLSTVSARVLPGCYILVLYSLVLELYWDIVVQALD